MFTVLRFFLAFPANLSGQLWLFHSSNFLLSVQCLREFANNRKCWGTAFGLLVLTPVLKPIVLFFWGFLVVRHTEKISLILFFSVCGQTKTTLWEEKLSSDIENELVLQAARNSAFVDLFLQGQQLTHEVKVWRDDRAMRLDVFVGVQHRQDGVLHDVRDGDGGWPRHTRLAVHQHLAPIFSYLFCRNTKEETRISKMKAKTEICQQVVSSAGGIIPPSPQRFNIGFQHSETSAQKKCQNLEAFFADLNLEHPWTTPQCHTEWPLGFIVVFVCVCVFVCFLFGGE